MSTAQPLQLELETYRKNKATLLTESAGKFVLIKNDQIVDVFVSQEDALARGYKEFGNTEFLVKKITEFEQIGNFTRSIS